MRSRERTGRGSVQTPAVYRFFRRTGTPKFGQMSGDAPRHAKLGLPLSENPSGLRWTLLLCSYAGRIRLVPAEPAEGEAGGCRKRERVHPNVQDLEPHLAPLNHFNLLLSSWTARLISGVARLSCYLHHDSSSYVPVMNGAGYGTRADLSKKLKRRGCWNRNRRIVPSHRFAWREARA